MKMFKVYKSRGSGPVSTDSEPELIATTKSIKQALFACQVDASAEMPTVATFKKVREALITCGSCILLLNDDYYLIVSFLNLADCEDDELGYCQSINMEGVKEYDCK